jgi:hypothetical protein
MLRIGELKKGPNKVLSQEIKGGHGRFQTIYRGRSLDALKPLKEGDGLTKEGESQAHEIDMVKELASSSRLQALDLALSQQRGELSPKNSPEEIKGGDIPKSSRFIEALDLAIPQQREELSPKNSPEEIKGTEGDASNSDKFRDSLDRALKNDGLRKLQKTRPEDTEQEDTEQEDRSPGTNWRSILAQGILNLGDLAGNAVTQIVDTAVRDMGGEPGGGAAGSNPYNGMNPNSYGSDANLNGPNSYDNGSNPYGSDANFNGRNPYDNGSHTYTERPPLGLEQADLTRQTLDQVRRASERSNTEAKSANSLE